MRVGQAILAAADFQAAFGTQREGSMRRHLIVFVLALGALAGRRLLSPNIAPQTASLAAPISESYLIILGVGDRADTAWDGAITATIRRLRGWRFSATDVINGTGGWHLIARHAPPGANHFDIKTMQGIPRNTSR